MNGQYMVFNYKQAKKKHCILSGWLAGGWLLYHKTN